MSMKLKTVNFPKMNIVTKVDEWLEVRHHLKDQSIGFVATMGHLHAGHMSLCNKAKKENEIVVVSIYVNPTQFNNEDDFTFYPRTKEADLAKLNRCGVDYVFIPETRALYPDDYHIQITEIEMAQALEGVLRPGHFTGMLTVVLKLLNLIQPACAYFGEKDYQQLLLIKKMAEALFLSTEIIACPTIRALNGLALSSRNSRLTSLELKRAPHFHRLLKSDQPIESIITELKQLGFKVDYIVEKWGRRLGAVWLGEVRLIDNVAL